MPSPAPVPLDDVAVVRAMTAAADSIVLAPTRDNVVVARRFVGNWISDLTDDRTTIGDLELAVSELVTNAIEHGDESAMVEVALHFDGSLLTLSVTSHGNVGHLAPTTEWEVADVDSIAGRGLGIVKAVVDRIDVVRKRDSVTVTVGRTLVA